MGGKYRGFIVFKVQHIYETKYLFSWKMCVLHFKLIFMLLKVGFCVYDYVPALHVSCRLSFTGLILFTPCVCLSSASCSSATGELPGCSTWRYRVALSLLHISSINKRLHKSSAHHRLQLSAPVPHAHHWSECLNPPQSHTGCKLKPAEYARCWSVRERTTQINDISIN